jgi:hypothetical protein
MCVLSPNRSRFFIALDDRLVLFAETRNEETLNHNTHIIFGCRDTISSGGSALEPYSHNMDHNYHVDTKHVLDWVVQKMVGEIVEGMII